MPLLQFYKIKMRPSESTGGTDTNQVEDAKLEHAVHQVGLIEDEEEGKGVDVLANYREQWLLWS